MNDELFSREEALQGPVGRRASQLLRFIERQTGQTLVQLRQAIDQFLKQEAFDYAPIGSFQFVQDADMTIAAQDIERTAPAWAPFIPQGARLRAATAHLLFQKYAFDYAQIPNLRAALALDDPAVQKAYADMYGCNLIEAVQPSNDEEPIADDRVYMLEKNVEWVYLPCGEMLFQQGEPGDSMCIVISGLLRVFIERADGSEEVVDELVRGETVGEMAVLIGERRSASVYAVRDSVLMKLSTAVFNHLAEKHPQAILMFTRSLIERWRRQTTPTHRVKPLVLAIAPTHPDVPIRTFVERLVEQFESVGPTLHLNSARLEERLGEGTAQIPQNSEDNYRIAGWLYEKEQEHRFVIYETDTTFSPWTQRCLRQTERVLFVASSSTEPTLGEIEINAKESCNLRQDLILLSCGQPKNTRRWLEARPQLQRHYHVCMEQRGDFARLVRFLTGRALGVVFSGGGARGIAEIGVIRAFREARIPIDAVGGSSAGGLAAAACAMGWDDDALHQIAKENLVINCDLIDYTLPVTAFLRGRKIKEAFQRAFGDLDIEDLRIPFFCIVGNITRSFAAAQDKGSLVQALLATTARPLLFPPVVDANGDLLVDGGTYDNMPVETMQTYCEGGPIIGVDVSSPADLTTNYTYSSEVSGFEWLWSRLNPFKEKLVTPSIGTVLFRSAGVVNDVTMRQQIARSNLYVKLPVGHFGLLDLDAFQELIDIGYQHMKDQIARLDESQLALFNSERV